MAYLDDIIIFSKNKAEHLKHIEIIFQKLKEAGLKLKGSKCDFFKKEIHYLGHLISDKELYPLPEKLDTIQNMPKLRNPKGNKTIPRFMWLLQEICTAFCRYFETFGKTDRAQSQMGLVH